MGSCPYPPKIHYFGVEKTIGVFCPKSLAFFADSCIVDCLDAIASRLEAIASRLEAIFSIVRETNRSKEERFGPT